MNTSPGQNHSIRRMVVALTGGIASGKTEASDRFKELGVDVIDTDVIAHDLTKPGTLALKEIHDAFGDEILDNNGELNRRALRSRIFSELDAKLTLERILHPKIMKEAIKRIEISTSPYCIVVIPLLFELGVPKYVDRVLVIDVEEGTQLERLTARDGLTVSDAQAAIANQSSRSERLKIADDVVRNDSSLEKLHQTIDKLHRNYIEQSEQFLSASN